MENESDPKSDVDPPGAVRLPVTMVIKFQLQVKSDIVSYSQFILISKVNFCPISKISPLIFDPSRD